MKEKITIVLFYLTLLTFSFLGILTKDKLISTEERRTLASFPKLEKDNLLNGEYFSKIDTYLLDQFPLRENFRKIKGIVSNNILLKKENNNVYITNNHLVEVKSNINYDSLDHFINKINYINNEYINKSNNLYFMTIPDKNCYINDKLMPKINYNEFINYLKSKLNYFNYIDITNELNISSYYKTDIHWKQESLEKVVRKIENEMNLNKSAFPNIKKEYAPFYGALYSRTVSNIKNDKINYLTNDIINSAEVYNYEKKTYEKVYNENYLNNIDKYDIYLSGASPLLIINNPNKQSKKELIIFRDSFASSLAPLLIENYSKITLIDLRYINSKLLKNIEILDFNNKDILFMYSIPIINNSFSLK